MTLQTMFKPRGKQYVPRIDEPSPFGADEGNPWIDWKNKQLELTKAEQPEGSEQAVEEEDPAVLHLFLKERLEAERLSLAQAVSISAPPLTTPSKKHLSLAWVIHFSAISGDWTLERAHQFGLEKMKKLGF